MLYEMLTGRRAFEADDVSLTLARVLEREPDWAALPGAVPPTLGTFLRSCLQKNPKQRIDSAQALRLALEGAFETDASRVADSVSPRLTWRRAWPYAAGAVVVVSLVLSLIAWSVWPSAEPRSVNRFSHDLPDDQALRNAERLVIAFSPDGRSVVYNTTEGLFLHTMDELEARLIAGTEIDLSNPFFSPDGQWVGFWERASGQLKRVGVAGGTPAVIASGLNNPYGASWGPDGAIFVGQEAGILRVPATGGTPELVVKRGEGEQQLDGPQLLPDGDSVLFSVTTAEGIDRGAAAVLDWSLVRQRRDPGCLSNVGRHDDAPDIVTRVWTATR